MQFSLSTSTLLSRHRHAQVFRLFSFHCLLCYAYSAGEDARMMSAIIVHLAFFHPCDEKSLKI